MTREETLPTDLILRPNRYRLAARLVMLRKAPNGRARARKALAEARWIGCVPASPAVLWHRYGLNQYRVVWVVKEAGAKEIVRSPWTDRRIAQEEGYRMALDRAEKLPNHVRVVPMGGFGEGMDTPRYDIVMPPYTVESFRLEPRFKRL